MRQLCYYFTSPQRGTAMSTRGVRRVSWARQYTRGFILASMLAVQCAESECQM